MNHRDLCMIGARWMLSQHGRNLYASAYEVAFDGGFADAIGVSCPDPAADVAIRFAEYARLRAIRAAKMEDRLARRHGKGVALFTGQADPLPHESERAPARVRRAVRPVIAICEVKRTRSDWLADVRKQKLRRYEPAATECWLLVAPGVVPETQIVETLTADGLPANWGILYAAPGYKRPSLCRDATPHRDGEDWEVGAWAARMLRSMAYRTLKMGAGEAEVEVPREAKK